MVQLWEIRLNNGHLFKPRLVENVEVSSDKDELRDRLRTLFLWKLKDLLDCEGGQKWQNKLQEVLDEIKGVLEMLNKRNNLKMYNDLVKKRDGLATERDLIAKRIEEFENGVKCMVDYLEGQREEEHKDGMQVKVGVYRFGREFDWERIHHLMIKECRRLDDGLPIFAFRKEMLEQIHCHQVTVLIGETGSGKSTKLVQFLADSGVAGDESVICTQPRKLAAMSLSQRVKEEKTVQSSVIHHIHLHRGLIPRTFLVSGRNFPVDIKYKPQGSKGNSGSSMVASYASDVLTMVNNIHKMEEDGTILAFLMSQMEVEWACENFLAASSIALPLRGKLSYEEQHRVFLHYPGKRKVIFTTNVAETSLTIPGVKYVVGSGMVKESRFEPSTGRNLLRVCQINQSSAKQQAG